MKKLVYEKALMFEHKEGSRHIDIKEIKTLVRALGVNPSNATCNMLIDNLANMSAESDGTTASGLISIGAGAADCAMQALIYTGSRQSSNAVLAFNGCRTRPDGGHGLHAAARSFGDA